MGSWEAVLVDVKEEDVDVFAREGSESGGRGWRVEGGGGGDVDGEGAVSVSEGEESREGVPVATTRAERGRKLRGLGSSQ